MLQALLLVFSLCLDSFMASIAYGTKRILIPFKSVLAINIICSSILLLSLIAGGFISNYLPTGLLSVTSFILLFSLGVYRLFESILKNYLVNRQKKIIPLKFKLFDINFVIDVYADETKADYDNSKVLTIKESTYLALALSLDSLAVGFSYSLLQTNEILVVSLCFFVGIILLYLGCKIGKKFSEVSSFNISWLSGLLLIIISILRIL